MLKVLIFTECLDNKVKHHFFGVFLFVEFFKKTAIFYKIILTKNFMQRIYLSDKKLWNWDILIKDLELLNQVSKVLRSKVWDEFVFFDGQTFIDFVYELKTIEKKSMLFSFKTQIQKPNLDYKLNLFQSLPNKLDKIEDILQKWCEVWYTSFNIFRANRSQDLFISDAKILRLEKIIIEAVEQSWRNIIPKLNFLKKLDFEAISWEKYFFHTDINISTKIKNIDFTKRDFNIFVWPEWGFSQEEIENFSNNNFIKVNLWANILRTQTASVVVGFYFMQNIL